MKEEQLRLFLYFVIVQEWLVVDVPSSLSFAILFRKMKNTLDERFQGTYVMHEDAKVFTYDKMEPCDNAVSFALSGIMSGMSFIVY